MSNTSMLRERKQSGSQGLELVDHSLQLTAREIDDILSSKSREPASRGAQASDVETFPIYRLNGMNGGLVGVYECPQCAGLHKSGLATGNFLRHPDCKGYIAPGGRRVQQVRLRWCLPEQMPAYIRTDRDRPQIGWTPLMFCHELRDLATEVRRRKAKIGRLSIPELRRLLAIYKMFLKCREYAALLAERLNGEFGRRAIGRAQRELRREIMRRHAGQGRMSEARLVEVGAGVMERLHCRGTVW